MLMHENGKVDFIRSQLDDIKIRTALWSGIVPAPFLYVFARVYLYKHPLSPLFCCS